MALATSTLRISYAPACSDRHNFRDAYIALDSVLEAWGYKVGTGSGAYNCRPITGGSGYSLHSYKDGDSFTFWNGYRIPDMALAVDINPTRNPYGYRLITDMPRGMVNDISAIRTNQGHQLWFWGGYFEPNNDAMHYQICCSRSSLASGVKWSTVKTKTAAPAPTPTPEPAPTAPKDEDLMLIIHADNRLTRLITPMSISTVDSLSLWNLAVAGVKQAKISAAVYDAILAHSREMLGRDIVDELDSLEAAIAALDA